MTAGFSGHVIQANVSQKLMTSISPPRKSSAVILGLEVHCLSPKEWTLWGRQIDAKVSYPRGIVTMMLVVVVAGGFSLLNVYLTPDAGSTRKTQSYGILTMSCKLRAHHRCTRLYCIDYK